MQYITVNYALNQTYHVHKNAFQCAIKKVISDNKTIKLIDTVDLIFVKGGSAIEISLTIDILSGVDASKAITSLADDIENAITDLINSKPANIKIVVNSIK